MKRRSLRDSVVVLTGASSGIGRATAWAFAERGAKLVLAARSRESLEDVANECRARGAEAVAVATDVRDEGSVESLRRTAVETFGHIDTWVNDAAVYMLGPLESTPVEAIRDLFATNVMGTIHGVRAAVSQFRAQGYGVVISMGSVAGKVAYAQAAAYCASKHAIVAINEALRQELQGTRIEACLVSPATVDTPLFQHAANYTGREIIAMRPIYTPERVASAIISCAERPRRDVVVGAAPRLMALTRRLSPWLFERMQPKMVASDHLGRDAAPTDVGNLIEPKAPHSVTGGWKERRETEAA